MSPPAAQGETSSMVFGYLLPEQHQKRKQVEQSVMLLVESKFSVAYVTHWLNTFRTNWVVENK